MIVYGDSWFSAPLNFLVRQLRHRVERAIRETPDLDTLRSLLIEAGQVEQAAEDALGDERNTEDVLAGDTNKEGGSRDPLHRAIGASVLSRLRAATDAAASAFYAKWKDDTERQTVIASLCDLQERLEGSFPSECVKVRIPEGFGCYALYPEQYLVSALRWLEEDQSEGPVLVVGLRSIGTTLSAIVSAALSNAGRSVRRITVRPTGPPFRREVSLPEGAGRFSRAIVVDEGPGLSGSSMAAVGMALTRSGLDSRRAITLMPAHGDGPGTASPEVIRDWWKQVRQVVTPLDAVCWPEGLIEDRLARRSEQLCKVRVVERRNISGGLWRNLQFSEETSWPVVCAAFERMKLLCILEDGQKLLWKFSGLAVSSEGVMADAEHRRLRRLWRQGWTAEPLGVCSGFIAVRWVEGRALSPGRLAPALLDTIAQYLRESSEPELPQQELKERTQALGEMLYWNTWEALGEEIAHKTCSITERAALAIEALSSGMRQAGDGHMAPHEWIETPGGKLVKVDAGGHALDHTMVGRQPNLWDVVATILEWRLDAEAAQALVSRICGKTSEELLRFYELAYAAFRLAEITLCGGMQHEGSEEKSRFESAAAFFRDRVRERIG